MRSKRNTLLLLGFLSLLVFFVFGSYLGAGSVPDPEKTGDKSQKSDSGKSRSQPAGSLDLLVFITTTEGCKCTLERNQQARKSMGQIQKDNPGLKVKNLDYISNHMEALPFMQKNQISLLPALLFLDATGQTLDKISGFLDFKTVQGKIRLYQKADNRDNEKSK